MSSFVKASLLLLTVSLSACVKDRFDYDESELKADGQNPLSVMEFTKPISLDPMEPGWFQYEFLWHDPMDIAFERKGGVPAIKLSTKDSASMLFRQVDIDLEEYPELEWKWYVERGINSDAAEGTDEGDDHPARIVVNFETPSEDERFVEIVWGNKIRGPQLLEVGDYTQYVARGTGDQIGKWHTERVNLLDLYRQIWKTHEEPIVITEIGLSCDSDDTESSSVSYFADLKMYKKGR
ncbi:MAG: DUF3047 domain-containing protein [Oligoflexales bacterium]